MSIFEGDGACLGASVLIYHHGTKFIVNSRGEPLFVISKESKVSLTVVFSVSHFYPMLFGKLRTILLL